ncbi:MAG: hypothetical protein WAK17_12965 [Candidatus Nitrosopolaris sp.]
MVYTTTQRRHMMKRSTRYSNPVLFQFPHFCCLVIAIYFCNVGSFQVVKESDFTGRVGVFENYKSSVVGILEKRK